MFNPTAAFTPPGVSEIVVTQNLRILDWDLRAEWWVGKHVVELTMRFPRADMQLSLKNLHLGRAVAGLGDCLLCAEDSVFEAIEVEDVAMAVAVHDHVHARGLPKVAV